MQTKKQSIIESVTNTVTGFILSLFIQWFFYPMFGFKSNISINIVLTTIFTISSLLRGYLIRRIFNKL